MRLFDLILAILVLAALLFVARRQFPAYDGKSFTPAVASTASASIPSPTPIASPATP